MPHKKSSDSGGNISASGAYFGQLDSHGQMSYSLECDGRGRRILRIFARRTKYEQVMRHHMDGNRAFVLYVLPTET